MGPFNHRRVYSESDASSDVIGDIIADLGFENAPNTLNNPTLPKPLRYSDGSSYLSRSSWQSTKYGHDRHYSTGTIFEKAEDDTRDVGTSRSLDFFKGAHLNGSDKILASDSFSEFEDTSKQEARLSSAKGKEKAIDIPANSLNGMEKSEYDSKPLDPESDSGDAFQTPSDSANYPSPAKTAVIMFSLYISIFLVALDRTIIGPAIPAITNQFRSLGDVGWYGSAYMLTSCGFILLYGRVYTFFSTKNVFLSGIALFEIGTAFLPGPFSSC
ncbi:unnamed protein product [Periconia digitata]|uniref:Major facilitator superfamily (MFS) profile domain-containing protein n=1 Tax=Periconia digitata TaxID=1303443 RepID=A0A9W4ULS8_9PLEO|nr:unnamed protein product [Periconia digitata]